MRLYGSTIMVPLKAAKAFGGIALLAGGLCLAAIPSARASFSYVAPQQQARMASPATVSSSMLPHSDDQGSMAGAPAGTVQGFANQVPLPIALRQVLPRGMAFQINNDVDTKTLVSWRGGGNWQQTLDEMLAAAGLQASYSGNSVIVQRGATIVGGNSFPNAMAPARMAPVTLTPSAPSESLAPMAGAYTPPMIEPAPRPAYNQPAPQPYVAPASLGVANTVADGNATVGAMQMPSQPQTASQPVQSAAGALPEGTIGELPQQQVPGTEVGSMPAMETSALNPLSPGPADASASLAGAAAQVWEAHSGQSLHEVLAAWSQRAGIELNWVAEYDYPIQASISFNGTFEEATRTLLGGFANASPQPIGRLHNNAQLGQQALIIETRGNQYDE